MLADHAAQLGLDAIDAAMTHPGQWHYGKAHDHFTKAAEIYAAIAKAPTHPKSAERFKAREKSARDMAAKAAFLQERQLAAISEGLFINAIA
jgi:hypothetical protein